MFDHVVLLARGTCIYNGGGGSEAAQYFASKGLSCPDGYNVADHLLDIASDPPSHLAHANSEEKETSRSLEEKQDASTGESQAKDVVTHPSVLPKERPSASYSARSSYATTFLTQLEVLSQREWKILRRWE